MEFRVSNGGIRVAGSDFRVSIFGFQVSGFGLRADLAFIARRKVGLDSVLLAARVGPHHPLRRLGPLLAVLARPPVHGERWEILSNHADLQHLNGVKRLARYIYTDR